MLLHEKFAGPEVGIVAGERQSRHLADIGSMIHRGILQQVLADKSLYATLIKHRKHYVRMKNIDYDTMQLNRLSILPPASVIESFRADYAVMQEEMIYGDISAF